MILCNFCAKRLGSDKTGENCFICNGALSRIPNIDKSLLIKEMEKIKGIECFCVESIIDKEFFIREEKAFDLFLNKNSSSIKSQINDMLISTIKSLGIKHCNRDKCDAIIQIRIPSFDVRVIPSNLYIFGAYKKLKQGISQKRWKKYEESVEELISKPLKEIALAKDSRLHASGREDVDAINTGFRPFVLELFSPYKRIKNLLTLENLVNNLNKGKIEVKFYGRAPQSFITLVSDSHFDKEYRAYLSANLKESEQSLIESFFKNKLIFQRTPIRVLGRRSDLIRKRKVYSIKVGNDSKGTFLDIRCEAGLYIKELISGDKGRTSPSISSILKKQIFCKFLVVKNINYSFLMHVFKNVRSNNSI